MLTENLLIAKLNQPASHWGREPSEDCGPKQNAALWIFKSRCGLSLTLYFAQNIHSHLWVERHSSQQSRSETKQRSERMKEGAESRASGVTWKHIKLPTLPHLLLLFFLTWSKNKHLSQHRFVLHPSLFAEVKRQEIQSVNLEDFCSGGLGETCGWWQEVSSRHNNGTYLYHCSQDKSMWSPRWPHF